MSEFLLGPDLGPFCCSAGCCVLRWVFLVGWILGGQLGFGFVGQAVGLLAGLWEVGWVLGFGWALGRRLGFGFWARFWAFGWALGAWLGFSVGGWALGFGWALGSMAGFGISLFKKKKKWALWCHWVNILYFGNVTGRIGSSGVAGRNIGWAAMYLVDVLFLSGVVECWVRWAGPWRPYITLDITHIHTCS